jgi:hypothetical protein
VSGNSSALFAGGGMTGTSDGVMVRGLTASQALGGVGRNGG